MKFSPISLKKLLEEITELPAAGGDAQSELVISAIDQSVDRLRQLGHPATNRDLQEIIQEIPCAPDVFRLFLTQSQDQIANSVSEKMVHKGKSRVTWNQICRMDPALLAETLVAVDLPRVIDEQLHHAWTMGDVLRERYRLGRGRAIAGQARGRALEDEIERGLKTLLAGKPVSYAAKTDYRGFKNRTAKCDFAIPSKDHPGIVIEAKGFEATGSKQTDVIGDVLKIIEAKAPHTYFFLVTDGRGWHRRQSDLEKLVTFHREGNIDMIYTLARLPDLWAAIKQIIEQEG